MTTKQTYRGFWSAGGTFNIGGIYDTNLKRLKKTVREIVKDNLGPGDHGHWKIIIDNDDYEPVAEGWVFR